MLDRAAEPALLTCQGLDAAYGKVQVLFDINLDVAQGEMLALLGTNGAGKSTLLRAISGLLPAQGGKIFFNGADITATDTRRIAQAGIVQMPGGRAVFPTLTVANCLRLAGWMYRRSDRPHIRQATARVLEQFPILRQRAGQLAGDLSGGEQQMLGLGMSLIAKPRLLLIDELSLGLSPAIVGELVDIVREIHRQGTTIILVEQSVNLALTLADRAVFMEKGQIRFEGPTVELLGRGDILRSVFLDSAVSTPKSRVTVRPTIAPERPADAPTARAPLILEHLTVRFGGIHAVDDVSFELERGEILGLIGPNGAGKTTLLDVISGFIGPSAGHVFLDGVDVTRRRPDRRAWAGLGRGFQTATLFPALTVTENLAVALERHLPCRDPLASALGLPAVAREEEFVAMRVDELLELVGLTDYRDTFASDLSTGTRRIVDLAMALGHRPSVLLLDEPASGLAQRETEALGPVLERARKEIDCSILVIEHDVPFLKRTADRLGALELGRLIAIGPPEEVVSHPDVVASYLGKNQDAIARSGSRASGAAAAPRRSSK